MHALTLTPALLLQVTGGLTESQTTLLMVFAGVLTAAIVIQALILISFVAGAGKARKDLMELAKEMHAKVIPVMDVSSRLLEDISPKVRSTVDNVHKVSEILVDKAAEVDHLVTDIADRVHAQTRRADHLVTDTLSTVEKVRNQLQSAAMGPIRQIVGLFSGVRAAVEKLTARAAAARPQAAAYSTYSEREREEMFGDGDDYHA